VFRNTSWLDALITLSAVAADSFANKIKVGTSMLNIVARNPVVYAEVLTGIDILSSVRLFAGVGLGSSGAIQYLDHQQFPSNNYNVR
jgi:alkanesulfonate monooxygenase SsuD/methylene tetrahydromethanopterin reductase-like flavin-dependent oxidoreductase (luciferase family)